MTKKVIFGDDLHTLAGYAMDLMSKAVQSTLGPSGKLALLDRGNHIPSVITKDGVTVARNILPLENDAANKIGEKILEICTKTNEEAGDGTTTAIVLAKALYKECQNIMEKSKVDPVTLKEQIEETLPLIIEELDSKSTPINNIDEMISVACISANNDSNVGNVVAEALNKVGQDGFVTLEEGDTLEPKITLVEGFQIEKGVLDIRFLGGRSSKTFENPYFLVYNGNINDPTILLNIIQSYTLPEGRPLIVVADLNNSTNKFLLNNVVGGIFDAVHIPPPMYKNTRQKYLKDIAVSVGAKLIEPTDTYAYSIKKEDLGSSEKVVVTLNKTNIIRGKFNKDELLGRIDEIKEEMKNAPSPYDEGICKERIGKLTSGVCVISVGGKTEQEMVERKDRFEDSLNATRAALQEGIIPGGGLALYKISKNLDIKNYGSEVLKKAIQEPIYQIIKNTGDDPEKILPKLVNGIGYDAKKKRFGNLIEFGVIDPVKVTKLALQNAVSVVDLLINLEVLSFSFKIDNTLTVLDKLSKINPEDM